MLDNQSSSQSDSDTSSTPMSLAAQANLVDPALLEKIDKLFTCGVGCEVDLPQLVVVGQQSSGKSSVLEALTGIPFPRSVGLCTRFATQITFRRALSKSVRVSIKSASSKKETDAKEEAEWERKVESLDPKTFSDIMEQAKRIMGIDQAPSDEAKPSSSFSADVLSIEVMSPEAEHFSIIDVPGIFNVAMDGTTKADVELVNKMVETYMYNRRSIMLVVVMANVDVATQEIIQRAIDIDTSGQRTFGILSKPDTVDKGAEAMAIDTLENRKLPLKLGWHMLRNPGQADLDAHRYDSDRTSEAHFFRTKAPWMSVGKDVGVESLKMRLQGLLGEHLERELPNVQQEIEEKLAQAKKQLDALGPKRESQHEHMQYLMKIAHDYRDAAEAAVRGDVGRQKSEDPHLRLANIVVKRSDRFSKDVEGFGHHYAWLKADTPRPSAAASPSPGEVLAPYTSKLGSAPTSFFGDAVNTDPTAHVTAFSGFKTAAGASMFGSTITTGNASQKTESEPYRPPSPFTEETLPSDPTSYDELRLKAYRKQINKRARNEGSSTTLPETSATPQAVIPKDARSPGDPTIPLFSFSLGVAEAHQRVREAVPVTTVTRQTDAVDILGIALPDQEKLPSPSQGIQVWLDDLYDTTRGYELGTFTPQLVGMTMRAQAVKWEQLALGYTSDIICCVHQYMDSLVSTLVPSPRTRSELMAVLTKEMMNKYQGALEHARFLLQVELELEPATQNHYFNDELQKHRIQRFRAAQAAKDSNTGRDLVDHLVQHMSNAQYTVRELHDILEAYYKVARKRFVDNVRLQVVDWHLVKGPNSPLKCLSPAFVSTLEAKQLDRIVGEEPESRMQRHKLLRQIKSLEEGKRILLEG